MRRNGQCRKEVSDLYVVNRRNLKLKNSNMCGLGGIRRVVIVVDSFSAMMESNSLTAAATLPGKSISARVDPPAIAIDLSNGQGRLADH